jgi:uncharacterized protein (DUF924 family)
MDTATTLTARDVLDFWFGAPGSAEHGQWRVEWFRKDPAFDRAISERFGTAIAHALAGGFGEWSADAPGALARVLLLDQFTRNAYRGTAQAFAGDPLAREVASAALDRGHDRELSPEQRSFLYLPFEHSESAADQRRSLELLGALARETGREDLVEWARKHAVIIERFGRYPHRNAILGRESTAEELAFLAGPDSSF